MTVMFLIHSYMIAYATILERHQGNIAVLLAQETNM